MPKAKNLKYLRKKHNLTQKSFADAIGVTRETVLAWEKRKRAIPKPSTEIICKHFHVNYRDFCDIDLEYKDMADSALPPTKQELLQLQKFRALPFAMQNMIHSAINTAYEEIITTDE